MSSMMLGHTRCHDDHKFEPPSAYDQSVRKLRADGSKFHVSCLFDPKWVNVMDRLRFHLSTEKVGEATSTGWDMFASYLGIPVDVIRNIENFWNGQEGREGVFYVLQYYRQYEGATIDKVVNALYQMQRLDVIEEIKEALLLCFKATCRKPVTKTGDVFRYNNVPCIPDLLQIESMPDRFEKQISQQAENKQPCIVKVMLTYADDSKKLARKLQRALISEKIGVLMLKNEPKKVNSEGVQFVERYLAKVDFVIPILSQRYFDVIQNRVEVDYTRSSQDEQYVKYVYMSLVNEYALKGFYLNTRVRCLLEDEFAESVFKSNLPLIFGVWFTKSRLNELIHLLLKTRTSTKN